MFKLFFWPPIHKFLVQQQNIIKNLFFVSYIFGFALIGLGFYFFQANLELFLTVAEFAGNIGTVSLFLFLSTLLPGILQRFKVLPLFSASIILFRRQMGILMFILAMVHSMFISTIPAIMTSSLSLENLPPNGLAGMIALTILLPVWLTSNDLSQKAFGTFWKTIQRLTYFALIAIFIHVALVELELAILTITVLLLELASWLKVWLFSPKLKNE